MKCDNYEGFKCLECKRNICKYCKDKNCNTCWNKEECKRYKILKVFLKDSYN